MLYVIRVVSRRGEKLSVKAPESARAGRDVIVEPSDVYAETTVFYGCAGTSGFKNRKSAASVWSGRSVQRRR